MTKSERRNETDNGESPQEIEKNREYTPDELARMKRYVNRYNKKPVQIVKRKDGLGIQTITSDILDPVKLMETFGTIDIDLQRHLLNQLVQTFEGCTNSKGFDYDRVTECANNSMSLLNGIQPRDEIEGMLAVQMVGVHNLAMTAMKRAMISDQTFEGRQANVNYATKLLRTYTAQMEALKKYRTGGQQRVTVEHVHVNEGGQAIVGNITQGGGGRKDKKDG